MSTVNVNLSIEGLLATPVVAGDEKASLERLSKLFKKFASGESNSATAGTVTLKATTSSVFSTGTVTFSGAVSGADTVTINGTALTAGQKNATGTAAFSTIVAGNSVTLAGVTFTARASPSGVFEFALGASDTAAGAACAAAVSAYFAGVTGIGNVSFSTIVADNSVTLGGYTFTAKASPDSSGLQFALGASDTTAAAALAAAVNAWAPLKATVKAASAAGVVTFTAVNGTLGSDVALSKSGSPITASGTALFNSVTASAATGTVTFRASVAGVTGNAITLSRVGSPITVSGAVLANGAASANNAFDIGVTATQVAAAFVAAVNASSTAAVSGAVVATNVAGVVTLKARVPGVVGNVTLTKSGTNIAVSGATLTGGALGATITLTF